tara:strand:- start:26 stop:289 length:264 start_codon:yes stop_codon:yes gene_type:complete
MPNTKSAIRRVRRVKLQTAVNRIRKSKYKSVIKKANELIDKKDKKALIKFLPELNSELMKASKTGIIKKNTSSRIVSRVTKKINKIK